jgi:hypothetical protein
MLMPDQRALLVRHCNDHPVAVCPQCSEALIFERIGAGVIVGNHDFCPMCQADLTPAVLKHLADCTFMRAQERETRERAREAMSNGTTPNGTGPHDPKCLDETRRAQQESERLRETSQEAFGRVKRIGRDYIPIKVAH